MAIGIINHGYWSYVHQLNAIVAGGRAFWGFNRYCGYHRDWPFRAKGWATTPFWPTAVRLKCRSASQLLVGGFSPYPFWKIWVSWDDEIPNWMDSQKIPWFQTTNQIRTTEYLPAIKHGNGDFQPFFGPNQQGKCFKCRTCSNLKIHNVPVWRMKSSIIVYVYIFLRLNINPSNIT